MVGADLGTRPEGAGTTPARGAAAVTCLGVDGRILEADDVPGLRVDAIRAEQEGMNAVLLGRGPLGDPFVLLAGLSAVVPGLWLGARVTLCEGTEGKEERHPALLAREATSLDLACGGRTILCFGPPFGEGLEEAISLCRAMWREGTATSEGPVYPVPGAVNRPRPAGDASPLIAVDLRGSGARDEAGGAAASADLVVLSADGRDDAVCRLERV
jgi:alkanesulfonate monooxygenase SsuD/methylene tetrahydromethanopterin reductase-like flavin-dependent oxidoreductase (luciferase family)